jgi:hypothetical protein
MATWGQVVAEAPELARAVQARFAAHRHKVLATLRADGSPRVSGIEVELAGDQVRLGMMSGSVKALDLLRDPRFGLHSGSPDPDDDDPGAWPGDAKIAGRAVEVTDPEEVAAVLSGAPGEGGHVFRLDVTEVVTIGLSDPPDRLVITSWHEGRGVTRTERT